MTLLIIPLLCLLAVTKITLQSGYSKSGRIDLQSNVFYNGIMFAAAAATLLPFTFKGEVSLQTLLFGILMGFLSFSFQVFYICAFSYGKMSLTVILNNFSMILPMIVSFVLFKENFGVLNRLGTVMALMSFVLTASLRKEEKVQSDKLKEKTKWLLFTALTFLCNGMISVDQKIYSMKAAEFQVFKFIFTAYTTATLLSLIAFGLLKLKNADTDKAECIYHTGYVFTFVVSGILLGLFQCLNTYAASVIKGTVLYSTYNCGASVLSVLVGRFLFKESLSKRQYAGLLFGIASIALLCL